MMRLLQIRRGWLLLLVLVVGLGSIGVGWLVDDETYLSSLLQGIGVAFLLVVPLLLFERSFERTVERSEQVTEAKVQDVRDEVGRVEKSLGQLKDELSARLSAAAESDRRLADVAKRSISFESIQELFERAKELNSISELGVRIKLPGQWERLRFGLDLVEPTFGGEAEPVIRLIVEDANGADRNIEYSWGPDDTAVDALAGIAESWKQEGSYPGDSVLDADAILDDLIETLALAIKKRSSPRGADSQFHPLIERFRPNWVMTDFGLEHFPYEYAIAREDLAKELEHWRGHMREKTWVMEEDELARAGDGDDFWMISEVASQFFTSRAADERPSPS